MSNIFSALKFIFRLSLSLAIQTLCSSHDIRRALSLVIRGTLGVTLGYDCIIHLGSGESLCTHLPFHHVQEHSVSTVKILAGPANRKGNVLILTPKAEAMGWGFFWVFLSSPKLLTGIVYILQYYYSCYELPKAATSKYCRACMVPA